MGAGVEFEQEEIASILSGIMHADSMIFTALFYKYHIAEVMLSLLMIMIVC